MYSRAAVRGFAAIIATILMTQAVLAQGFSLEHAAELIRAQGYEVEIDKPEDQSALVTYGEGKFSLDGYNCTEAGTCTEFLFGAGYKTDRKVSLEDLNTWNANQLGGRAYLDEENDPWLDHVLSVGDEDDDSAFTEGLILWLDSMATFEAFIFDGARPDDWT